MAGLSHFDARSEQRADQLSGTAALTGESVDMATSADALRHLLRRKGPGLLFGMIQKQRGSDAAWKVCADSDGQKVLIERWCPGSCCLSR